MTDPAGHDFKLTRRTALGAVAGAGAASLVVPGVGQAAAAVADRGTRVFSQEVGATGSGATGPFVAPRQFQLVGVQWSAPRQVEILLRARRRDGAWSRWVPASTLGHGPDRPARPEPLIGEGIWTGPADEVELQSSKPLRDVRLHYVNVGPEMLSGARTASIQLAQPVLDAGPGQPPIIARQVWAQGHAPPVVPPAYGTIKLGFVHHTVNPNGYSPGEVPSMLYGIYLYHVQTRGFDDIAYNFIVDLFGRIWEARAGGIDQAVVGAQAGGYNLESTGAAVLGTFSDVLPSEAALTAVEHLLAWKLSLHGLPTSGHVTVVVDPKDYFYTPFRPGQHVSLPRVAGHRDGDITDCPGNAFYYHLPVMRPVIASLAGRPMRLTLSGAAAVVAGTQVTVAGSLRRLFGGAPVVGAPIELIRTGSYGAETTLLSTTTGAAGAFGATLSSNYNIRVHALHRPAPTAVSDSLEIAVAPAVTLSLTSATPLRVQGTVYPSKRHVTLEVYSVSGGRRRLETHKRVTTANGRFAAALRVKGPGPHEVVAVTAADAINAAGSSARLPVG